MVAPNHEAYTVRPGDRMEDIARLHQLDLRELYFKNRMPFGSEPQAGETLRIYDYIHFKQRPRIKKPVTKKRNTDLYPFEETIELASD